VDILHPLAQHYAEKHTSPQDSLLQELEHYTRTHHPASHMISGLLQGRFLQLFSSLLAPQSILEIGTMTGYSALCLASGLTPSGQLHTIELRETDAAIARSFFDRSAYATQLHLHCGDAHEIIPSLEKVWDLVFIDADKVSYLDYFNMIFPAVRVGGYILADNIFFHGQVFEEPMQGKNAKAISIFNEALLKRDDVEVTVIPLRDGLSVIKKVK
jgi:predicted O-methyltransferase YrrM